MVTYLNKLLLICLLPLCFKAQIATVVDSWKADKDLKNATISFCVLDAKTGAVLNELKEVKGKIIGDASCFDRAIPGNWIWADISNYFGVAPCGLSYNDNKFKIIFNSKEIGSKAIVDRTIPAYCNSTICINSNVISKGTEDDAFVFGDPYSFTKDVSGKIPPNSYR